MVPDVSLRSQTSYLTSYPRPRDLRHDEAAPAGANIRLVSPEGPAAYVTSGGVRDPRLPDVADASHHVTHGFRYYASRIMRLIIRYT
jgi:hypothetical protein